MIKDEECNKIILYAFFEKNCIRANNILVILPLINIISKFNIISNLLDIFDRLKSKTKGEADESSKKNGIFF